MTADPLLHWLPAYQASPHSPGVYWFIGADGAVLYVGKAKDLKNRLGSYTQLKQLRGKTRSMVLEAVELKYEQLENELQALLVEAELIGMYQPPYNILLKDDKSPLYIHITDDLFPQVKTIRKKDMQRFAIQHSLKSSNIFGPYQSAYRAKQILKLIRPIFQWCDAPVNSEQLTAHSSDKLRPCFYYHIERCSGACVGAISADEYRRSIDRLRLFLRGKAKHVQKEFLSAMQSAVQQEKFEDAAAMRDALRLIDQFLAPTFILKPDLQLPKLHASTIQEGLVYLRKEIRQFFPLSKDFLLERIEGFDVSNIQGQNATVSMVTFVNGAPDLSHYRLFNIRSLNTPNDYQMMKEAITRRQRHPEWGIPSLVVIDGGRGQLRAALSVWGWDVPVVSLVKNPDRLVIPVFASLQDRCIEGLKYHFVHFPPDHPTLRLLQQIRDESHRFAKKQHTRLRNRSLIES